MFRHNFILSLRNFKRFKSSFFINLIGLSTGLACTLLIYLWVTNELNMDKFHEKDSRLFQVMGHQQYADDIMTTTSTPGILAETLAEEIPEIEHAATITWINSFTLSVDDQNVKAEGYYVGKDYFNIFSYELVYGDPGQVLADKKSIVISGELAKSLFGSSDDAIGKMVELQHEKEFMVSGIFAGIPNNSSYQFDFVLPFEEFKDENNWVTYWWNNGPSTYVTLHEGSNAEEVNNKIEDFIKGKYEDSNVRLFLKKYSERYLYGRYENGVLTGGRIEYVRLFSIIAVFILVIACINFMNLSTARASRRMKEVGIKKVSGAGRGSLVNQYLGESMIMSLLSMVTAWIMVWLFLPEFNEITQKELSLNFNSNLISWSGVILVMTGILAGSYPAFYLSGFKPATTLKGVVKGSLGELWVRRGLVVFQFFLSVVLIVSVLVIFKQIQFVQTKNLGYDNDNVIYFPIEGRVEESIETFLNEIKQIPGIVSASSIGHNLIGRQNNTYGLEWEDKDPDDLILFENVRVNYELIETLDIEIIEGRAFSRDFGSDTAAIIFNETAIDVMGLEDPVGKVVRLWNDYDLQIIGVARDFHFQSLHRNVEPLFFMLSPENTWNVMVRIEAGREKETLERLQSFYKSFNPGFTLDYNFIDERFQRQYAAEQRVSTLSQYFAGFAILISCLGLFGLAAFTAERRLKEIGIRKALGSSVSNIVYLLTSDFTRMVLISILIALPVSYWALYTWLERFAYRIDLQAWFFIGAGLIALVIAWLTVSMQAFKAARVNPTECLRDE